METIETYTAELPDYALSYIHNNDASGIDDADVKACDAYLKQYYDRAAELGGYVIIGCPDDEGSFTHRPAFGLACTCVTTEIIICR
jgi:hypothetical protein